VIQLVTLCLATMTMGSDEHSQIAVEATSPGKRYAFATLLTMDSPGYLVGTLMLGRSLRETGSLGGRNGKDADLLVLISSDRPFSEESVKALKKGGFKVVRVGHIDSPFPKEKCGRYCDFYIKLRLWQLPYERVVYLDCDMLVRHNINNLLEIPLGKWPAAAAVPECSSKRTPVNGGFYVLEPSEHTFKDMYNLRGKIEGPLILNGQDWEYTEQTFLHAYFRRCFFDQDCDGSRLTRLPEEYNARMNYKCNGINYDSLLPKAHIWHFAGDPKPWNNDPVPKENAEVFKEYREKRAKWGI